MLASLLKRTGLSLSLNDPRWGRKPQGDHKAQEGRKPGEGPPDLDQMWRDFNARLNRLFGPRGEGGGGGYRPGNKGIGAALGAVAVIALLIWLASGAFIVQDGQKAVVSTFGAPTELAEPGFNWRWPAPIQSHEIVNVGQPRTEEIGYRGSVSNRNAHEAQMPTDDENLVDVQFAVEYSISDPKAWLFNNRDQGDVVRQIAEAAMREVVGRNKTDVVLYTGREKVAADAHAQMQAMADQYRLGAHIDKVTLQAVRPPEQVQAAFDDATKALQDRERARSEGQGYADDVLPRARGDAFRVVQDAEAYRATVVETATGNAARFNEVVAEYQKAPGVTRDRMYLDTMQEIFTNASKVLLDAKSSNNTVYLPLDKLMAQNAAHDATIGAKSGPVVPPAAGAATTTTATPPAAEIMQPLDQARRRDDRARESSRDRESR